MLSDESLRGLAARLVEVGGIDAVVLGGSRARGEHTSASDVDLGLYYRPPVDWLYRDVDRMHRSWREARDGHVSWHFRVGHPLGVPSFAYVGEAALAVVLADTGGEVTRLQQAAQAKPPRLRDAKVGNLWEAGFLLAEASKAAQRGDSAYVAGFAFRAVLLCAHAVHAQAVFDSIGAEPRMLAVAVELARLLVDDTRLACSP